MNILIFMFIALPASGFSALQWLYRYTFHRSTMNEQDAGRVAHWFGINSPDPRMVAAWVRLRAKFSFENLKNLIAEWSKLDAHRASFFLAMVAGFWFLIAVGLGVAEIAQAVLR